MAAFNYIGTAKIVWKDKADTVQFVYYDAEDDILTVWPCRSMDDDVYEYRGTMGDHPALHIHFNH